ncbi:MAG: glycogen debranching protein GlgX [Sphingobium sp.]
MSAPLGAHLSANGASFAVHSRGAEAMALCLFDGATETRLAMTRDGDVWRVEVPNVLTGQAYGYRADGLWSPEQGQWFDPAKLLVDPYAITLDRRFTYDARLSNYGEDTADLVPKALVQPLRPVVPHRPPRFARGGLVYELNVRGYTMLHPDVPPEQRGTVAALAHPSVIDHFKRLHINAIELMPIVAWIDERHLPPLGLTNAWGYNPVVPMALDPGLCPGGVAELRNTVAALHAAGIGVILDLVFNHSGESNIFGPILSMRGLDNSTYYAHEPNGALINDTGCGNTLDFGQPAVRDLTLDSLRHFVRHCGVDGFRFDLAPIMARSPGFSADAPIFTEIAADPLLADRIMIAEPWDIGPGGYQLGQFPDNWLEWNDRYRDDVRRFWRGDVAVNALATRIAGSSDVFGAQTRSVNFLAAHDGFTLGDTVSYEQRHNEANGEQNRDGHGENFSWNNGVEGPGEDSDVRARRAQDLRALLATLFASTGTIMLSAGDEFGRTQAGNNNAYCQDNALSWVDWSGRDRELEQYVMALAQMRAEHIASFAFFSDDCVWCRLDGAPMTVADWEDPATSGVEYISYAAKLRIRIDRVARSVTCEKLEP